MSMSMHCFAVKPSDDNYRRKAEAYRACEAAGISIPDELAKFFDHRRPDPTGTTQEIGNDYDKVLHPSCVTYNGDMQEGFEVDITKLPDGTRFVRFYCAV
jgi:hypothetical protein